MVHALASPQLLKNSYFFFLAVRRDNKCNVLADSFVSTVAEKPLRTLIPTANDSVQALTDYSVVRGFDDGGQQTSRSFGLLSFPDVVKEIHDTNNRSVLVAYRIDMHRKP